MKTPGGRPAELRVRRMLLLGASVLLAVFNGTMAYLVALSISLGGEGPSPGWRILLAVAFAAIGAWGILLAKPPAGESWRRHRVALLAGAVHLVALLYLVWAFALGGLS